MGRSLGALNLKKQDSTSPAHSEPPASPHPVSTGSVTAALASHAVERCLSSKEPLATVNTEHWVCWE